jgi:acylphosphatase
MNRATDGTQALLCRVTGRVQGVFFRASAQRRAQALGVVGYARNLADGSVEVLAIGPPAALEALRAWLAAGPPGARVRDVQCASAPIPDPLPGGFATR